MAGSGINANAMHKENRPAHDRIAEMFTDGIVTADNMEYWNGEMKRHADALAKAEAARSTFKSEAQADEPPEGFFEEFVASLTQWSKGLELNPDDDALKRLLVGMMVQDVICTKKNQFKLNLVLSKRIKWWA